MKVYHTHCQLSFCNWTFDTECCERLAQEAEATHWRIEHPDAPFVRYVR